MVSAIRVHQLLINYWRACSASMVSMFSLKLLIKNIDQDVAWIRALQPYPRTPSPCILILLISIIYSGDIELVINRIVLFSGV